MPSEALFGVPQGLGETRREDVTRAFRGTTAAGDDIIRSLIGPHLYESIFRANQLMNPVEFISPALHEFDGATNRALAGDAAGAIRGLGASGLMAIGSVPANVVAKALAKPAARVAGPTIADAMPGVAYAGGREFSGTGR